VNCRLPELQYATSQHVTVVDGQLDGSPVPLEPDRGLRLWPAHASMMTFSALVLEALPKVS
jgi:hypothetical protein